MHSAFDAADLKLLSLANEKRKFAISIHLNEPDVQFALERGIDNQWFTLVDVSLFMAAGQGQLMRVFRLTDAGLARLAELGAGRGH